MLATMRRRAVDDPIEVKDLQQSLMLSSGGTTKRLDRLESAGLIQRHPDPNNRHGTLIALTGAGFDLISEAVPAITHHETALVGDAIVSQRNRGLVEDGLRHMLIAQEAAAGETL